MKKEQVYKVIRHEAEGKAEMLVSRDKKSCEEYLAKRAKWFKTLYTPDGDTLKANDGHVVYSIEESTRLNIIGESVTYYNVNKGVVTNVLDDGYVIDGRVVKSSDVNLVTMNVELNSFDVDYDEDLDTYTLYSNGFHVEYSLEGGLKVVGVMFDDGERLLRVKMLNEDYVRSFIQSILDTKN